MTKIVPTIGLIIYAALGGLALGGGGGAWLTSSWYSPRLEAANLRADNLAEAIKTQNDAIDKMGKDKKRLDEELRLAQDAAKKRSAVRQTKAQVILATPLPPGADQCTAASALIRQELAK
jgi:hypothetical protein